MQSKPDRKDTVTSSEMLDRALTLASQEQTPLGTPHDPALVVARAREYYRFLNGDFLVTEALASGAPWQMNEPTHEMLEAGLRIIKDTLPPATIFASRYTWVEAIYEAMEHARITGLRGHGAR